MIAIIGAMQVEVEKLIAAMNVEKKDEFSSLVFYVGTINNKDVVVVKCGVGKVNAGICAQAVIMKYNPDLVINIGVAGSLNPSLDVNDIVVATSLVQHDYDITPLGEPLGRIDILNEVFMKTDETFVEKILDVASSIDGINLTKGIIASGDQFIASETKKNYIKENFNADLAEMEGGAIAQVCTLNNVPFAVLRSVSDKCNDDSPVDFPTFATKAADISSNLIFEYLKTF